MARYARTVELIDMVKGQEDGFKVREPIAAQYHVVAAVNQQRVVSALIVDEQTRVAGYGDRDGT